MGVSTVTRNYQITLPRDVREMEKIRIGDKFIVKVEDKRIVLTKLKESVLKEAFGSWKETTTSSVEYVRKLRNEWKRIV